MNGGDASSLKKRDGAADVDPTILCVRDVPEICIEMLSTRMHVLD